MKKLNKFFAVLVALAMMATLCVSMAFAVDEVPAAQEADKASTNGKLVKYLVVPEGVKDFPVVESTFTFTGVDGTGTTATEANNIKPDDQKITIEATSTETNPSQESEAADGLSRVASVTIPSLDLTKVTHPGVYVYTVEESNFEIKNPQAATGAITKDGAKYTVRYSVVREGEGYKIKYVTVTKYDAETKQTTTITDPTKDYDPGQDGVQNDGGFSFKNTYKLNQSGTTYDNAALKITKTIDHMKDGDTTKFPMTFTLTKAEGLDNLTAGDTTTTIPAPQYQIYTISTKQPKGTVQTASYGEQTVNIGNDEAIVFLTLPVGTKYVVSETMNNAAAYSAYAPSVANGSFNDTGALGATLAAQAENAVNLIEEDDADLVAYTNDYNKDIDTPTGILISNLPYIALALVAIGGLVAYVVVRRRQSDEA